jgi:2,4-dienoyl-CoA reductase-like NADH-dependent reductase (Old Yellow Enzyme family)
MTNSSLAKPLVLPCGAVLSNRLGKAAMSEGIADARNHATPRLVELYRRWGRSGAGLLLSGNIQADAWHLERPGNVVLNDDSGLAALARVAEAGKSGGAHFWAQVSHTGRQVTRAINAAPLSPSDAEIDVARGAGYDFARPRPMSEEDIALALHQFARTAALAKAAGFTGVELHAAHGYLISQFLSPLANRRTDRWGGSLENRARFLLATIASVRAVVGADFPVGIKLNSSDFQRGGFTHAECIELVHLLNESTLDLLELSGGSLEQPKVVGVALKDEGVDGRPSSTKQREAYFIEFARALRRVAKMPVMMVGGFRTADAMRAAIDAEELDMIGIGRPMIADPMAPAKLISGEIARAPAHEDTIHLFHLLPWFNAQIERLADGLDPDLNLKGEDAVTIFEERERRVLADLLAQRSQNAAA